MAGPSEQLRTLSKPYAACWADQISSISQVVCLVLGSGQNAWLCPDLPA